MNLLTLMMQTSTKYINQKCMLRQSGSNIKLESHSDISDSTAEVIDRKGSIIPLLEVVSHSWSRWLKKKQAMISEKKHHHQYMKQTQLPLHILHSVI